MNSLVMTNSPFPTALLKTTQNHPAEGTVRFGVWAKINTSVTWQISDQCGISLGRGRGQWCATLKHLHSFDLLSRVALGVW